MPEYRRHGSKAVEWTDGDLVPSRLAVEADSEVWFPLPVEDDGVQFWEALNGRLVEAGLVELRAVPALAYGMSFGDLVGVVRSGEGALVVTDIREPSSFATFRIWLGGEESLSLAWRSSVEKYAKLGCLVDAYSEKLIAIACPEGLIEAVTDALESQASISALVWEQSSPLPGTRRPGS